MTDEPTDPAERIRRMIVGAEAANRAEGITYRDRVHSAGYLRALRDALRVIEAEPHDNPQPNVT